MAAHTRNANGKKRSKRDKSRRARKTEALRATRSASQSPPSQAKGQRSNTTRPRTETPGPDASLKLDPSPPPAAPAEAAFLMPERLFFDRDESPSDEFESPRVSLHILQRRLWFRRQVLRIVLVLSAFTLVAVALWFLRAG